MFNDCIIMAGGSGTRLWPASTAWMPKQFLPMPSSTTGESFFNAAVERALALINKEKDSRIIIVAGQSHVNNIVKACSQYSAAEKDRIVLIPEPQAKNTAPAVCCAIKYIDLTSGKDRKVIVLTSDHIISPLDRFLADAEAAETFVLANKLAIFGIKPQRPETGYGYIEAGQLLSETAEQPDVYKVQNFREKPDRQKAEEYLAAGNFYWNSGMFAFPLKYMLNEFRRSAPDLIQTFDKLEAPDDNSFKEEKGIRILNEWPGLSKIYAEVKPISFDYAITEKCPDTVMVKAGFHWIDVGSWDEYAALMEKNLQNTSEVYQTGSTGCFVDSDIPVAIIGAEDLIIAVRSGKNGGPGSVLIAKKGTTQQVREIVDQIKEQKREELL